MDEKENMTIVDLTRLISIIYQMKEKQGTSKVRAILEAIIKDLPEEEETINIFESEDNSKKNSKETVKISEESHPIEPIEPINNSIEEHIESAPLIYNPEDYAKVKEDNTLNNQVSNTTISEAIESDSNLSNSKEIPSDVNYSTDMNEVPIENYETSEGKRRNARTLNPPFATAPYYNDTESYQEEMPPVELNNSMVDWSDASFARPGQSYSNLRQ